jgi:hypothetical protein
VLEALVGDERDETAESVDGIGRCRDAIPAQVLGGRVLGQYLGEDAALHQPGVRRDVLDEFERLAVRPGGVAACWRGWLGGRGFRHGTA